ncbi:hypothetical protein [Nostoc sp. WHI]|uniref:hypothetical protein n=1 Tax=Nostoc sp. WHI TaxID=2650611 RepID=UPI0018C592F6|nr:hypothetical protein [Nostoc sp. WHI]
MQKAFKVTRKNLSEYKFEIYNGQQVHLNWMNYNQQIQQNLRKEVARKLKQQQTMF